MSLFKKTGLSGGGNTEKKNGKTVRVTWVDEADQPAAGPEGYACVRYTYSGKSVTEAAINSGNLRFRAVMMTAWSFIFGVMPLVFASGAGAAAMKAIGICTCSGMLAATLVGIVFVPPLYAIFQRVREFVKGEEKPPCQSAAAAS